MLLEEAEIRARNMLAKAGIESAGLCARLLIAHVLQLSKLDCLLQRERPINGAEENIFFNLVRRCEKGEPLAYLLGVREFYDHEFAVNSSVLIPRPETELIIELALKLAPAKKLAFADFGCGSGCIGLSLLALRPEWEGILLERDFAALAVAGVNAACIAPRARLIQGDFFYAPFAPGSLDLIVSNPPYIAFEDQQIMPQVAAYEPHHALFSEDGGLAHIKAVVRAAARALRGDGLLIMEHGAAQGDAVSNILQSAHFTHIEDHKDLAGLSRCCIARK